MLSKYVHDAGWSSFIAKLSHKAENAGRRLIAVNPAGTSQACICGASVGKLLSDREHVCTACGLIAPRDVVSAQVILQRVRIGPSNRNVEELISSVI
jgi:putative transposase